MKIILNKVSKKYGNKDNVFYALNNVSLTIDSGEFVIILGQSGSGKTTLLNIISTLDTPSSGDISYDGLDYKKLNHKNLYKFRAKNVGYIFQKYHLLPMLSVSENIEIIAKLANNQDKVDAVLKDVDLLEHKNKRPIDLSGGQQQRVAIARALIKDANVLFCDEPTGALDTESGIKVMELIKEVNETKGTTVILVTHNSDLIKYGTRVIKVEDGKIVYDVKNTERELYDQK